MVGFLHPIIHLGFGIEFEQPAIVAEALAQAAVHDNRLTPFLMESERVAQSQHSSGETMEELLDQVRADQKVATSAHWGDRNKLRDGVLVRAREEMIRYASQWRVDEASLRQKTAEMYNATAYFTGAAQRPPKVMKFDFFSMGGSLIRWRVDGLLTVL